MSRDTISRANVPRRTGIPITGNVNTAGIAWDFGCVPLVPAPEKLLTRNLHLREAKKKWNVSRHYTTHHYGWWNSVAADLGKWTAWEDYEPDYDELLTKIAIRDYGKKAAPHVRTAWKCWSEAMITTRRPMRISTTLLVSPIRSSSAQYLPHQSRKDINFPTARTHIFGGIVKTFLHCMKMRSRRLVSRLSGGTAFPNRMPKL